MSNDDRPSDRIVLAQAADFTLGGLRISPASREIAAGPARELLQPRIMQVLVVLAQRRGEVVSHDELIRRCWDGCAVSDDAIHRCIGRLRRLAEAHGGFRLETIPRVGYRLVEAALPKPAPKLLGRIRRKAATLLAAMLGGAVLLVAGVVIHL